jgi:hypothetical protein
VPVVGDTLSGVLASSTLRGASKKNHVFLLLPFVVFKPQKETETDIGDTIPRRKWFFRFFCRRKNI